MSITRWVILLCLFAACKRSVPVNTEKNTGYTLVWSDEFEVDGAFDTTRWSYAPRGHVAWNKYMTALPAYAQQKEHHLVLRMDNATVAGDAVPYHSGGVQTMGKFSIRYGKVEVRAKFTQGRGSWPAIWMMPEPAHSLGNWPAGGEIDIMEHVNNEAVVHQTIHNTSVTDDNGGSTATHQTLYAVEEFNTYSMVWNPQEIRFYVNDVHSYTYSKAENATSDQWPFEVPFYIILNQAGGAGWPGPITDADLPFTMWVDYVRVYKAK